jgi:hypothetical protein
MAARTSAHVRRTYVLTGSPPVKVAALQYDAVIMDPPPGQPSVADYLAQGCRQIAADLAREGAEPELLVLLFANAAAVTKEMVDAGVEALLDRPELDSALSVAPLERWSPALTRRLGADGLLEPMLPAGLPPGPGWHPTRGCTVLRPAQIERPTGEGEWPWLGRRALALKTWGPGPVDYRSQLPSLEYWLKKNGVPDLSPNLELQPLPKPQLAPKGDRR